METQGQHPHTDVDAHHHISGRLGLLLALGAAYLLVGLFVALDATSASALFGPADFLAFFAKMLAWPVLVLA